MKEVIISILILIAFVCTPFLITEFKFLILMLKIKSCERLCKKAEKKLKHTMECSKCMKGGKE